MACQNCPEGYDCESGNYYTDETPQAAVDLMAALKASLDRAKQARSASATRLQNSETEETAS